MKRIEMIVQPDGKVHITTEGFVGPVCREASRFLEAALGSRQSEQLTTEFYRSATIEQQNSVEQ